MHCHPTITSLFWDWTAFMTENNCIYVNTNQSFQYVLSIPVLHYLQAIRFLKIIKMNCELMLTYDTPALRQTGSRNLTGQKTLPTIWHIYMKLVTKYQIPVINSCLEKCDEKYLGRTEGRTDRGKTVYPPPPSGSGDIKIVHEYLIQHSLKLGGTNYHLSG